MERIGSTEIPKWWSEKRKGKLFNFKEIPFINSFLKNHSFGIILRNLYLTQGYKDFCLGFHQEVLQFSLTFRSMIHFPLIFVHGLKCSSKFLILNVDIQGHLSGSVG